jgi:hypothetical protein
MGRWLSRRRVITVAGSNGFRHVDANTHDNPHGNSDGRTDQHECAHGDGPSINDAACTQQLNPSHKSDTNARRSDRSTQPTHLGNPADRNRCHGHCLLPLEGEELDYSDSSQVQGNSGAEEME